MGEDESPGVNVAALASQGLLFLLIGGMAGSCDALQLIKKFTSSEARGIGAGIVCQYIVLPLMGYMALSIWPQEPVVALTLLMVTTSPGGGFSGFWCSVSNADLALSVAMTTASTIAVMVFLPLNIYIYINAMFPDMEVAIAWDQLVLSVVVVVLAVVCGAFVSWAVATWSPQDADTVRQGMNTLGSFAGLCLMIFGAGTNAASDKPLWENEADWFACIGLPCVLGLVAALGVARSIDLAKPSAVAVAIECCYQNTGLALTIALSAVPPEAVGRASGVPIFYGLVEIALIPIFAISAWKAGWTYAPADENPCIALAKNYQPSSEPASYVHMPEDDSRQSLTKPHLPTRRALKEDKRGFTIRGLSSGYLHFHSDKAGASKLAGGAEGSLQTESFHLQIAKQLDTAGSADAMVQTLQGLCKDKCCSSPCEATGEIDTPRSTGQRVTILETACAVDLGDLYRKNAKEADDVRKEQKKLIQALLKAKNKLPFQLVKKKGEANELESALEDLMDSTKTLLTEQGAPRLVDAFADLDDKDRLKIVEDYFFESPRDCIYAFAVIIDYARRLAEGRLWRCTDRRKEELNRMIQSIEEQLADLLSWIDCPLDLNADRNGDGEVDQKEALSSTSPLIDLVMDHPDGWHALKQMAQAKCMDFIGSEKLESFFSRHYHGSLSAQFRYNHVDASGMPYKWHKNLLRSVILLIVSIINVLCAPLLAIPMAVTGRTLWKDHRLYVRRGVHRTPNWSDFEYGGQSGDVFRLSCLNFIPPALYLLEEPWMEGLLRSFMEVLQVVFLASLRTIPSEQGDVPGTWSYLNLVWACSVLVYELTQQFTMGALYSQDRLNIAKLFGLILSISSLAYNMMSSTHADEDESRNLMAIGVLLLWLQQLRIVYHNKEIGPLVFLVFEMWKDVLTYIIINFMFVLAFGVAFFAIYYDDDGLDCGMQLEDDQKWLATNFHGSETGFFTNIYKMLQFDQIAWFHDRSAGLFFLLPLLGTSLTGDNKLDCMRQGGKHHGLTGPLLMIVFLMTTFVLLTNMLIAMMNYRFTAEFKRSQVRYRHHRAFRCILGQINQAWDPPSPLNLLFIFAMVWNWLLQKFEWDAALYTVHTAKTRREDRTEDVKGQLELAQKWYSEYKLARSSRVDVALDGEKLKLVEEKLDEQKVAFEQMQAQQKLLLTKVEQLLKTTA